MKTLSNNLIKMATTEYTEVLEKIKNELADVFAEALYYEGCVDKARALYKEQMEDCNDETFYAGVIGHSNFPIFLSDILKKAVKKVRTME